MDEITDTLPSGMSTAHSETERKLIAARLGRGKGGRLRTPNPFSMSNSTF